MMDGDVQDSSPFGNHGVLTGGGFVPDRFGNPEAALLLDGVDDHVRVPATTSLGPKQALSLSLWFDPAELPGEEEVYLVSHGSWENRWKVTLGSTHRVRWTVHTDAGITDLDSGGEVDAGLHHLVATFGGGEMELYLDGALSATTERSGQLLATELPLLVGQKLPGQASWNLGGVVDDLRLFNRVLSADEVEELFTLQSVGQGNGDGPPAAFRLAPPWPNPFNDRATLAFALPREAAVELVLYNLLGRRVHSLPRGRLGPGRHRATLSAAGLASGWYLVELRADGSPQQRRTLLLVR
jgi:hypothetical protein